MQAAIPGSRTADGVLVTRPAGDFAGTAARLAALGRVPIAAPLLVVRGRPGRVLPPHDALVVSSRNALAALLPGMLPLLAVGDATAEAARAAGFGRVHSAGGTAADLVGLACGVLAPGSRLVVAAGAGQGAALAAGLRAAGFRVHRRVAYAAVPVRRFPDAAAAALEAGAVGAALFLSAETARVFVRLVPARLQAGLCGVEALAIGAQAADVLSLLPWQRVRVSVGPTLDQVLALL